MLKGILLAHEEIKKLVAFQEQIVAEIGKPKREFPLELVGDDIKEAVRTFSYDRMVWAVSYTHLDVYKRQCVLRRTCPAPRRILRPRARRLP